MLLCTRATTDYGLLWLLCYRLVISSYFSLLALLIFIVLLFILRGSSLIYTGIIACGDTGNSLVAIVSVPTDNFRTNLS